MKCILVATDLTHRGARAVQRATQLSQQHTAKLIVVHVVESGMSSTLENQLKETSETLLNNHLEEIPQIASIEHESRIIIDHPPLGILRTAIRNNADLIVCGVHRPSELRDFFRGTTVERILKSSHVPLLIAGPSTAGNYRKIVLPMNFSPSSELNMRSAIMVAPNAKFTVLHAHTVPGFAFYPAPSSNDEIGEPTMHEVLLRKLNTITASMSSNYEINDDREIEVLVREDNPFYAINQVVREKKADLLALTTHWHKGGGNLVSSFVSDPPCDILITRAHGI